MTCRMLVAAGAFSMRKLLSDFKLMAMNKNEKHELNENNSGFIHGDGWGIVVCSSRNLEYYRKAEACWKDPKFNEYLDYKANFVILHARRASANTPIGYKFTHPFSKEGWYFCHNGTIKDFISNKMSDSERFFLLILDNLLRRGDILEAIRNAVSKVREYTALNFIMSNKSEVFVLVKYRKYPRYYTMKYLQTPKCIIVSSEILPSFDGDWREVPNDTLLKFDVEHCQAELVSIN